MRKEYICYDGYLTLVRFIDIDSEPYRESIVYLGNDQYFSDSYFRFRAAIGKFTHVLLEHMYFDYSLSEFIFPSQREVLL